MSWSALFSEGFLKIMIGKAILEGIPSSYLAYFLLLPVLASLVAATRHLLGIMTYGTFIPALLAIIWLELGLVRGGFFFAILFFWAWLVRSITKKTLIKRVKVNYLPRMAILLLFVSVGLLFFVLSFSFLPNEWGKMIPFLLILLLIIQNIIDIQTSLSKKETRAMFWETIFFALFGYFLLGSSILQNLVLSYPGWTVILIFSFNIYVGRFIGFRFLEHFRFKSIIEK